MELIKGKVAAIKSNYAIIINKGSDDGVEEDMRFVIYEEGEEIHDPDTRESLGKLEYIKAKVKVKLPNEKYSWAETYETYAVSGLSSALDLIVPKQVRVSLPLNDDASISDQKKYQKINVGDLVRQILD